jgi:hypothetical protein
MFAVTARPFRKSKDINGGDPSDEIHRPSRAITTTRTTMNIPTTDIFKNLFMSLPKVEQAPL